jgi:peptide/nickel transport system ATP-binding protein
MMQQYQPATSHEPLLEVDNLVVEYPVGARTVHAVSGVSLQIARGETLGLVGESGCGKSTLGRAVLQLRRPTSGKVLFDGDDLTAMQGDALRLMRRRVQLIFQDPIASLNPRRRIGDIVAEPLVIAGVRDAEKRKRLVDEMLAAVGLDPAWWQGGCRMNSPADNASVSALHARWCSTPNSSSATNRFPHSTSPSARRSSTCWKR